MALHWLSEISEEAFPLSSMKTGRCVQGMSQSRGHFFTPWGVWTSYQTFLWGVEDKKRINLEWRRSQDWRKPGCSPGLLALPGKVKQLHAPARLLPCGLLRSTSPAAETRCNQGRCAQIQPAARSCKRPQLSRREGGDENVKLYFYGCLEHLKRKKAREGDV